MGILSFLFGEKKKIYNRRNDFPDLLNSPNFNYRQPKYYEILKTEPRIVDFWGRGFDYPKYNDRFKTDEKLKLRELLLFVWWGKTKNGRKSDVTIPKYFFLDYNLNAQKLTRLFRDKKWLIDDNDKTKLSDQGRIIFEKYKTLWEIHSAKGYPTNLDVDFPKWNKDKFEIMTYQCDLEYYTQHSAFCDSMIKYLDSLNCYNTNQEVRDDFHYYQNEHKNDLSQIKDIKEKLAILNEQL